MDMARTFEPRTILLWRGVADDPEARRIVGMFPEADLRIVEHQRNVPLPPHPGGHAIVGGKRVLMIGAASSFLREFSGGLGGNVRCAPYVKLVPVSNGCPYYCTYCYLAYVHREHLPLVKVNVNHDRMLSEVREAAATLNPVAFNMGEMLDSLALDHVTRLTQTLVPFFAGLPNGFLMLLTKSANVDGLLSVPPNRQVVVSWSLNAQPMIDAYEPGTASLDERIAAARRCQAHGYRIRLRIDPGILYPDWRAGYAELIRKSLAALEPENITLGMLRLLPGHLRLATQAYGPRGQSLQRIGLTRGASDGKLRYAFAQRLEFYRFLIDVIRSFDEHASIGLCRETQDIWNALKHQCHPHQCNCLIW